MIRMPLPWLVFTALVIFLAGIVLVWIGYEIVRRQREAHRLRDWIFCRLCSFRFKAEPTERLPVCPQCGSRNEHVPASLI